MKFKIYLLFSLLIVSCSTVEKPDKEEYIKELNEWKANRLERLKSDDGWLNLAGLYWLEEGVNTIGSDSSNTIIFPNEAPDYLGKIVKEEDFLYFNANEGVDFLIDSTRQDSSELKADAKK